MPARQLEKHAQQPMQLQQQQPQESPPAVARSFNRLVAALWSEWLRRLGEPFGRGFLGSCFKKPRLQIPGQCLPGPHCLHTRLTWIRGDQQTPHRLMTATLAIGHDTPAQLASESATSHRVCGSAPAPRRLGEWAQGPFGSALEVTHGCSRSHAWPCANECYPVPRQVTSFLC